LKRFTAYRKGQKDRGDGINGGRQVAKDNMGLYT
jgi:hypothetical protein